MEEAAKEVQKEEQLEAMQRQANALQRQKASWDNGMSLCDQLIKLDQAIKVALEAGDHNLEDPEPLGIEGLGGDLASPWTPANRWSQRHDWAVDTMLYTRYELIKVIGHSFRASGILPPGEDPDPDLLAPQQPQDEGEPMPE